MLQLIFYLRKQDITRAYRIDRKFCSNKAAKSKMNKRTFVIERALRVELRRRITIGESSNIAWH